MSLHIYFLFVIIIFFVVKLLSVLLQFTPLTSLVQSQYDLYYEGLSISARIFGDICKSVEFFFVRLTKKDLTPHISYLNFSYLVWYICTYRTNDLLRIWKKTSKRCFCSAHCCCNSAILVAMGLSLRCLTFRNKLRRSSADSR
jgi:hypothetical protein